MSDDKARRDDAPDGGASTGSTPALTTVGELMEERRRYESWLQALEARRGETPKHVFTRVHADYTARLERVISRLTTHAEGMRTAVTALTTRLAHLDEQQHRARDERAEAELRAHVGEISQQEWERVRAAADEEIAQLARKHAETAAELERTKALVADAERPATPPAPVAPVKKAAAPEKGSAPKPAPRPAPRPAPKAAAEEVPDSAEADLHVPAPAAGVDEPRAGADESADAGGFDELAFLHSVVDAPGNGAAKEPAASAPSVRPPRPAPQPAPRPAPQPAPPPAPESAPLASPKAAPPSEPPPVTSMPDEELTVTHAEPAAPTIVPKRGGALAANVSGNNPVIIRDKAVDSAKTLKCAECGALNYPTEWYCERCGAELASM